MPLPRPRSDPAACCSVHRRTQAWWLVFVHGARGAPPGQLGQEHSGGACLRWLLCALQQQETTALPARNDNAAASTPPTTPRALTATPPACNCNYQLSAGAGQSGVEGHRRRVPRQQVRGVRSAFPGAAERILHCWPHLPALTHSMLHVCFTRVRTHV
jgi:hypothetical protein